MSDAIMQALESSRTRDDLPTISVGDTVDVHVRIIEGAKERIQVFSGVVLKKQGSGLTATITVRRIVANEGVERTFPVHSPKISKIEIKRRTHARRSKLYYLRERVGKSRRLRDRRRGLAQFVLEKEDQPPAGDEPLEQTAEGALAPEEAKASAAETEPVQEETGDTEKA